MDTTSPEETNPKEVPFGYAPLPGRCNARRKKLPDDPAEVRRYCMKFPVTGRTRCRKHGGATPRGVESPHYRGRGYSRDIPTRLYERLQQSADDPELLSMASEIALLDARVGELFAKMPTRESADAWAAVDAARSAMHGDLTMLLTSTELTSEQRADTYARLQRHVDEVGDALTHAYAERALWGEILEAWSVRNRFVDTERKREEMLEGSMSARQTLTLLGVVSALLMEFITDPARKKEAAQRLRALLEKRDARTLAPPSRVEVHTIDE